jgi:glucosamine--fructose-6-phosphate aminotransferase (isomerizing)
MCGIVGFVGSRNCVQSLLDQLSRLEYRGYDSAGIAVVCDGTLDVIKTVGKIKDLKAITGDMTGTLGICHTRWATHGAPSTPNSHPHTSCKGDIAVVHNGIVENYLELREELIKAGHVFKSETDTEVIAHLVEKHFKGDLLEAVREAVKEIEGSYAIGVISSHAPGILVAARKDSPLILGVGKGENYIASDIPALLGHTREFMVLEDGDMAVLTKDGITLTSVSGKPIERKVLQITWDAGAAEKGGYEHFMIKEIHEQPAVIKEALRGRLTAQDTVALEEMKLGEEQIKKFNRIYIVACGTAYYAGCVGKYFFEKVLGVPVEVDLASEFRYRGPILDDKSLVIAISQSGETADTLAAIRLAKKFGSTTAAVVNVVGSSLYRECDSILYTRAGPEICVASTKAYITQIIGLYLMGVFLARARGAMSAEQEKEYVREMRKLPDLAAEAMKTEDQIKQIAKALSPKEHAYFLGRGLDYAVGLEGALKLKEISYIHAEAYAAGEMKHGPLALITKDTWVIVPVTQDHIREKTISNIKEMQARGATILALLKEGDPDLSKVVDYVVWIPKIHDLFMPVPTMIPLQLLSYWTSQILNREIDQPRNLAKSVTVE